MLLTPLELLLHACHHILLTGLTVPMADSPIHVRLSSSHELSSPLTDAADLHVEPIDHDDLLLRVERLIEIVV